MGAIMLQGTGSDVGKSVLTAGLCRLFANRGMCVRPFKPQNMSNNAAPADHGEIGRAQALQALAARTAPSVDMNPVLLKPQSDLTAQVIVSGKVWATLDARSYQARKAELLEPVCEAYSRIAAQADLVIVEGAGSPAEINLRQHDIANMGFARASEVPVLLIGDIDRGGVIASLVGTRAVLHEDDAELVRGFIINKFRGDLSMFHDGLNEIVARTGWRSLGVVPWLDAIKKLPAEDAVRRNSDNATKRVNIAVPMLSRIANSDDLDALADEPEVQLTMIPPGRPLPGDADLIIIPGTKATIEDLRFFRLQGWDVDLQAHVRRGGYVLGICGGYQMLGRTIADPERREGVAGETDGLNYLPIQTIITSDKCVRSVSGSIWCNDASFDGYEIHSGTTTFLAEADPLLAFSNGTPDGAVSGRVAGCYVHGLFNRAPMRAHWLKLIGATSDLHDRSTTVDKALNDIATELEQALDVEGLLNIAEEGY